MTNQQPLLDRIRDLETTVFSLETKLAVRGYEAQIDDLQNALFQAQKAAIDLAKKVETLEAQLAQAVWNYGEAKREVLMEREACAKLADEVERGGRWFNELPAAIRARGTT